MGKRLTLYLGIFSSKHILAKPPLCCKRQELLVLESCYAGQRLLDQGQWESWPCLSLAMVGFSTTAQLFARYRSKMLPQMQVSNRQMSWCLVSHHLSVSCCYLIPKQVSLLCASPLFPANIAYPIVSVFSSSPALTILQWKGEWLCGKMKPERPLKCLQLLTLYIFNPLLSWSY